jgi:hypothetical protein
MTMSETSLKPEAPSAIELVRQAADETQQKLDNARLNVHQLMKELNVLRGEDTYKESLRLIVEDAGKDGVTSAALREIFPDSGKLKKATEELMTEGRITAIKQGMTLLLKLSPAA